jgi:hypothetical protein
VDPGVEVDIDVVGKRNGDKFGTLRSPKGSLVWLPRNGVRGWTVLGGVGKSRNRWAARAMQ